MLPASIPQRDTKIIWIWGLTYHSSISFLNNIVALIISIICTIIILINTFRIILTALKIRNSQNSIDYVERIWLISGFIIIIMMVIWIFSINYLITYSITSTEKEGSLRTTTTTTYRFWDYNTIGFGIIGVLLGGILTIIGACIKGLNLIKKA